jgi:predicted DCC family thiol-disulfide oxidoreductase YuxK
MRTATPPTRPTLIYDGDCSFCQKWVQRFKRWEVGDDVITMPMQEPAAVSIAGRPLDRLAQAMHLVLPDGRVFAGAAAARELTRFMPALPGLTLRGLRYRLGCEGGHCTLPLPAQADHGNSDVLDGAPSETRVGSE